MEEKELLLRMNELEFEFKKPALYVRECLGISQQPDEGVQNYLSRLK